MKKLVIKCLISFIFSLTVTDNTAQNIVVVRRNEINEVLTNPGKGFTTFQCFNGDYGGNARRGYIGLGGGRVPDCYGEPVTYKFDSTMINIDHPQSTVAYFRIKWSFLEPGEGKYNWKFIDSLLVLCENRNQTLALSIAPYTGGYRDLPGWLVELWKNKGTFDLTTTGSDNPRNAPPEIHNDSLYVTHYSRFIWAIGYRYDGHPYLESVDVRIVGAAGEGGGTDLLTDKNRLKLVKAYTDSFRKTPLIVLGKTDKMEKNVYYLAKQEGLNVGWRKDCLGDMFGFSDTWSHMHDDYPQSIEQGMKAQDAWEKAHITFEACWTMLHWKEQGWDIDYIIDQSLKWHISTFNNKSSPVPEEWQPQVDRWLKRMGYRFVLRKFTYPETIQQNGKLEFTSWWENTGVAPIYRSYALAIQLKGVNDSCILLTDVDIKTWLPGDNLYDDAVFVPLDLQPGEYELQIGIVDAQTHVPKVNLAIEGRDNKGWYSLGNIEIKKNAN